MKKGVYKSIKDSEGEDNYGANAFTVYIRNYLLFVDDEVFKFSTSSSEKNYDDRKHLSKKLMNKKYPYQGQVESFDESKIKFHLIDNFLDDKIIFEGKAEGERFQVKRYRVYKPEAIIEETYEYVGTLEDLTS